MFINYKQIYIQYFKNTYFFILYCYGCLSLTVVTTGAPPQLRRARPAMETASLHSHRGSTIVLSAGSSCSAAAWCPVDAQWTPRLVRENLQNSLIVISLYEEFSKFSTGIEGSKKKKNGGIQMKFFFLFRRL